MRKQFFYSVITSMTVVGSVIGAGFITGKEIYEFFAFDFSWSGIYLSLLLFTLTLYLISSVSISRKLSKVIGVVVAISNVIVSSCMLSALDSLYCDLFCFSEKVKILSVITVIFLFIATLDGIGFAEKFNSVFIPFIVVAIIAVCLLNKGEAIIPGLSPRSFKGVLNPTVYVGFNVILSFAVIKNSGEKLSPPFKLLSALLTALILCVCIFLISRAIGKKGDEEMPFKSLFDDNVILAKIIDVIMLFAIYSTLVSSVYTVTDFGGIRLNIKIKLLLLAVIIATSEIGFSTIVESLYPKMGIISYGVIIVTCLLREDAQGLRRERTYRLPKHIK